MQLEVVWDKRQSALVWYSERLDAQWVGGGISSVKASASIIQSVVHPWMASAGAGLGGSCSPDNNDVSVHGAYTLLAQGLTTVYRSWSGLEFHPHKGLSRGFPHSPASTRQMQMC